MGENEGNENMKAQPQDRLLSVEEAAYMLGIRPKTLYVWSSQGKIEKVKIGKSLRFRESVLLQLLTDHTIETAPGAVI